jgi:hypothetical protein
MRTLFESSSTELPGFEKATKIYRQWIRFGGTTIEACSRVWHGKLADEPETGQQVSGTTSRPMVSPLIGCWVNDRLLGDCESFEQVDLVRGAAFSQASPDAGSTCTGDIVLRVVAKEHEASGLDA